VVAAALGAVEASGDMADVALRLARRVDREGATPSSVRELRYALQALGVIDLEPYRAVMRATMAAIDASNDSLPTLAAQLREQEQTCQRLGADPANSLAARVVREAVDELVEGWAQRWRDWWAGVDRAWSEEDRERSNRLPLAARIEREHQRAAAPIITST